MRFLHNTHSNMVLRNSMIFDKNSRITVSFYKYIFIKEPKKFRDSLYKFFSKFNVLGRVYIANEGINAQVSILKKSYKKFITFMKNFFIIFKNIDINEALDYRKSFWVLRIKVKKKLLCDDLSVDFFNSNIVGKYLSAEEVNIMFEDRDSIFVDMRNNYEYQIGHFENAINYPVNTFREQLHNLVDFLKNYRDKKIIMYCTGGIRCEKSTAWIKYNGFKYVYHIKGGIIKYVNDAKKNKLPIKFKGKNFVFDERMSEKVSNDILGVCKQCSCVCDVYTNCFNNFCHNLFIQCRSCRKKFHSCCSINCINYLRKKYKYS
ncbi:MAG: rhodanese-related sulfurtransferase [Buchnera aphidicola (Chaetogeoica yunlongensis)]